MPDGVLLWFDDRDGSAVVVHNGRRYPVATSDIDAPARHAGARVHFDVTRDGALDRAANVSLRGGSRTGTNHRRVADLTGARRLDTKGDAPFAAPHPELGHHLAGRPLDVGRELAALLASGDVGTALLLYAPDAVVQVGDDAHVGLDAARRVLEEMDFAGRHDPPSIHGGSEPDTFVIQWHREPGHHPLVARLRIRHGVVVEHRMHVHHLVEPGDDETGAASPPAVAVVTSHDIDAAEVDRAVAMVQALAPLARAPVLHAGVRLTMSRDPAVVRPASASATLDANGTVVRATVTAASVHEAVDLLKYRLHERLTRLLRHDDHRRREVAAPPEGEWRHDGAVPPPGAWFDRPPEDRRVVRRKTYEPQETTVEEALFDLEVLDHDFHLFRDLATGQSAVIARVADGYELRRFAPADVPVAAQTPVALHPNGSVRLRLGDAVERLNTSGERFVFFHGPDAPDGALLYRRYDGHYGLVEPSSSGPPPGS
ncbi:MAG TPA: sigma 54 modulation/S30EA ribosomal C-terminal domain-containing protein [Acidimicrobiales bacterium]|nr:sigma 54 modulation/S30EA ribosomal C-terminal domain-containing protein [Acidimicrobiales bacterium]